MIRRRRDVPQAIGENKTRRNFLETAAPAIERALKLAKSMRSRKPKPEKNKAFTPLELAPYRFSCAVNTRSASIPDGVKALMGEIGAREASIFLKRDGGTKLVHYLTTDGKTVDPRGGDPEPIVQEVFEKEQMKICIPRKKGKWPPSRIFTATMVPEDITFASEETWRYPDYMCAVPLMTLDKEEDGQTTSKKLGVLILKGDKRKVRRSNLAGKESIEKVGVFIAGASRVLSKIIDDRFDLLTGLPRRPELIGQLKEMARNMEAGADGSGNFSMFMIDIDHFKRINDNPRYGHDIGDVVLRRFAQIISASIRSNVETRRGNNALDLLFRYGGEEFVILLPNLDAESALAVAERLRAKVENTPVDIGRGEEISITCSIGVVDAKSVKGNGGRPPEKHLGEMMTTVADRAMYHAKNKGRNGVVFAIRVDDELKYFELSQN